MTTQEFEFIQAKIKRMAELKEELDQLRKFRSQHQNVGPFQLVLRSATNYSYLFEHLDPERIREIANDYNDYLIDSITQLEAEMSAIIICKKLTDDTTDNPGPDPE